MRRFNRNSLPSLKEARSSVFKTPGRRRKTTCVLPKQKTRVDRGHFMLLTDSESEMEDLVQVIDGNVLVSILSPEFFQKKQTQTYSRYEEDLNIDTSQGCVDIRLKNKYEKIEELENFACFLEGWKALLRIANGVSELCRLIISTSTFESLIIVVIIFNILVLSLENPNEQNMIFSAMDEIFLIIYTIEAALKIFALGFVSSQTSYLRDNWNKMDLLIVITGWLSYLSYNSVNFSSVRTLRILRPLRSISSISGLRVIFVALIKSAIPLFASLVVLFFFLLIFAIAGIQLWSGSFRYQCLKTDSGVIEGSVCGIEKCEAGEECAYTLDNPNYGVTNFDNIFFALLIVFQCITLEGWTNVMVNAQKSFGDYVIFYFLPLVFIGAFLLLSITLAVIKNSFSKAIKETVDSSNEKSFQEKNTRKSQIRPKIQEILPDDSIEVEKERENGKNDSDKVTFNNVTLRNRGINLEIQGEMRHQVNFEVDSQPDAVSDSLSLLSDIDRLKCPPEQAVATRANNEMPKENQTAENHQNFRSSSLRKALSARSFIEEPNNHQLVPQSFLFFRGLTDKYDLTEEISEFKFFISDFELHNTSLNDLVPAQEPSFVQSIKEKFLYSGQDLDYFEEKDQKKRENLNENYGFKSKLSLFFKFSIKSNKKTAFDQFFTPTRQIIESVLKRDLMTQTTTGIWSGFSVDEKKFHSELIDSLNKICFRSQFEFYLDQMIQRLTLLTRSAWFHFSMITCVILNTIVLSIDHFGISDELSSALSLTNTCFTYIFLVEMLIKLTSKGVKNYFKDYMNLFDAIVVILSIIELIFLSGEKSTFSAFRIIRVFRIFRVVRVARLFRYLNSMRLIMKVISGSMSKFIYIALLLLLFTFIYTLLGMQVFRDGFDFPEGKPRSNFDTFHNSFISTFQVLSIENWQTILFNAMRSRAGASGAILLISWIILGNFILLNLFLAILLEGFNSKYDDNEAIVNQQPERRASLAKRTLFGNFEGRIRKKQEAKKQMMKEMNFESDDSGSETEFDRQATMKKSTYDGIVCEKSLLLFEKDSKVRIFAYDAINNKVFDYFVLLIITCSTVKVAVDTYLIDEPDSSKLVKVMNNLDLSFTVLFFLEFLLKSIALGFYEGQTAYIRDPWNSLDFLIVTFSIIDLSLIDINFSVIKSFRILRTLRPLRFISHNISMKIVIVALFDSLIAIFNVIVVLLIVWLIFAILGVSLIGGKLYSCSNFSLETKDKCLSSGFEWDAIEPNYDNVINAISTLFILSSEEGWPDIMYQAVDSRGVDLSPRRDSSPYLAYYFVIFILIGSFFFLNFFIGVVFDKFNWAKRNEMSTAALVLTKEQALWVEIQHLLPRARPHIEIETEKSNLRKFCTRVYKSRAFELFIILIIIVNILQMAMVYNEASNSYLMVLENINLAITLIFIFEAVLKITGSGPSAYFYNNWNRFDFFVVTTSVIDLVLSFFIGNSTILLRLGPQMFKMLRVFRISKMIRIFKALKTLETLITIFGYSLPAILNVLSLLTLIFFIYSVLGVNLFHSIESGKIISSYTNFHNFGKAMITLFRVSTGEDWYLIMYDCQNAVNLTVSAIFFMSFVTITSFVMLNFFIMVIIQTYDDFEKNPFNIFKKFTHDIKVIKKIWAQYADKQVIHRVHFRQLTSMMKELSSDFGDFTQLNYDQMMKKMSAIQMEIDVFGFIYYNDFLFAIMKYKYRKKAKGKEDNLNKKLIQKEEQDTQRKLAKIRTILQQRFYTDGQMNEVKNNKKMNFFLDILNAKTLFKTWKKWTKKRKMLKNRTSVSVTPLDSFLEYPGEISLNSEAQSSSNRSD